MNKSDSIVKLAEAFCAAQAKIEGAVKGKTNPAFRSKYADLASTVDAIRPALSDHSLSFVQLPQIGDNSVGVETILLHASGEWLSLGTVMVPVTKNDAHGFGSALTYARRYGLMTGFGVPAEDDDGNAAVAKPEPKERQLTGDEIASVTVKLEEAAKEGTAALAKAWGAIPSEAKVQLRELKESLKHKAADFDAAKQERTAA